MANLTTNYMGLQLKSPIIIGANNLVKNPDNLKRMEDAGAGAIVYKSLFEEQVLLENLQQDEIKTEFEERYAEMTRIFPDINTGASEIEMHLNNLRKARESVSIPVIASLNAIYEESWVEYARKMEQTGVAGLELNFYTVPEKFDISSFDVEKQQTDVLRRVKQSVSIPVSVKLSPFYSNPLKLIADLENAGANGFVMFNRLFQPDIDIESEEPHFPFNLSNKEDNRLPLRFAGLLYGNTKASICSNTGILNGGDVIKMILAGADAVQIVSAVYLNQIEVINTITKEVETWMDQKGYGSLNDFRGKLSRERSGEKLPYHRAQYLDFMLTTSEILKKYRAIS